MYDTISGFVVLLPYLEQAALKDSIYNAPSFKDGTSGAPWSSAFTQWTTVVPGFQCPSEAASATSGIAPRNYHMNVGDHYLGNRGAFQAVPQSGTNPEKHSVGLLAISDGTSNTLMFAERQRPTGANDLGRIGASTSTIPSDCSAVWNGTSYTTLASAGWSASARFGDGRSFYGEVYTILPPNGPNCSRSTTWDGDRGFYSASSNHTGGVNASMCDGSVRFIRDSIAVGNQSADANTVTGQSPYGVWGAIGSRNGGESVTLD